MTGKDGCKLTVGEFCYLGPSSSPPRSSRRSSLCAVVAAGQRPPQRARPLRKSKETEKRRQLAKEIAVHTPPTFLARLQSGGRAFRKREGNDHHYRFVVIPALLCSSCKARSVEVTLDGDGLGSTTWCECGMILGLDG